MATEKDTYEVEFEVILTKTVQISADNEDSAIGELYKILEQKNIERERIQALKVRPKRK
jgi:hypothetical protein